MSIDVWPLVVKTDAPLPILTLVVTGIPQVTAVTFRLCEPSIENHKRLSCFADKVRDSVLAVAQNEIPASPPVPNTKTIKKSRIRYSQEYPTVTLAVPEVNCGTCFSTSRSGAHPSQIN